MNATKSTEFVVSHLGSDPSNNAHIVFVPEGSDTTPQALVMQARVEGLPVTALCGHTWVPQRDPKPLPVCSKCLSEYHADGENRDDREELPDA